MSAARLALPVALLSCLARGEEGKDQPQRQWRYRIEVLYTVHACVDTDEKLERIRALVKKAYPDATFAEVSVVERKVYYGTYRDRLLRMAGEKVPANPQEVARSGYEMVKGQVAREVELRAIYEFLHARAKSTEASGRSSRS
jgi:hypothetical protein